MRILSIRLSHLNSLVGSWTIDFTHPSYTRDGIFAITGPTGAGKTTILDALCLALYRRTPRLGDISASSNEVMSRQAARCSAEVEFVAQNHRYRASFSQSRAYGKVDGNLGKITHEIACAETGKVLATKLSEVDKTVVSLTGMNFSQFTRSVLLAQGDFAAFLKASSDERAPLLEQITGTDLYSDLSIYVYKRWAAAKNALVPITAEASALSVLPPEEVLRKETRIEEIGRNKAAMAQKLLALEGQLVWLRRLDALKKELSALELHEQAYLQEKLAFAKDQERLEDGLRSEPLRPVWEQLQAQRSQCCADKNSITARKKEFATLAEKVSQAGRALEEAESALAEAEKNEQTEQGVLKQVRALDPVCRELSVQRAKQEDALTKEKAALESLLQKSEALKKHQAQLALEAERIERDMQDNARDAELQTKLEGVRCATDAFGRSLQERRQREQEKSACEKMLEQARAEAKRAQSSWEKVKEKERVLAAQCDEAAQKCDLLLKGKELSDLYEELSELRTRQNTIQRIQSFEEQRKHLAADTPCPLCGSLTHPYVTEAFSLEGDGLARDISDKEKQIKNAKALVSETEKRRKEHSELQAKLLSAEKTAFEKQCNVGTKEQDCEKIAGEVERALKKEKEDQEALEASVAPFGCALVKGQDIYTPYAALQERLAAWNKRVQRLEALREEERKLEVDAQTLASNLELRRAALEKGIAARDELVSTLEQKKKERLALYGEKNPDVEEKRLAESTLRARKALATAQNTLKAFSVQRAEKQSACQVLEDRLVQEERELARLAERFGEELRAADFSEESAFIQALLEKKTLQALQKRASALKERALELATQRQEKERSLQEEEGRRCTEASLEELEEKKSRFLEEQARVQKELGGLEKELEENEKKRSRLEELEREKRAGEAEFSRWNDLYALIGSEKGTKFRNIAQEITFEILIEESNRQLQKMTDRYLLLREQTKKNDAKKTLEFSIIDGYQGDTVRSVKNLSGGESFIVSLALALGLSHMASQKRRVESLFIDEGFGTLDEDALETALQTLGSLREDGKMICVISHVLALQNRIATQIQVRRRQGGRSTLEGPGITCEL